MYLMGITAAELKRRLERIKLNDLQEAAKAIIEKDSGRILFEYKKNEFEFGLRPNFKKIGKYTNDNYAFEKNIQNPLAGYGQIDLIKTGAFVNSLFVYGLGNGRYLFDGSNSKTESLVERYGRDILGLNKKTFTQYQYDYVAPEVKKYIISKARGR